MIPDRFLRYFAEFEPEGDPKTMLQIACLLEEEGNLEAAAAAYDRAWGLNPGDEEVSEGRQRLLDALALVEHGIRFRYIPGGSFLMGSLEGEPDETPWHPVWLTPYWMAETPLDWTSWCQLLGWSAPPAGMPEEESPERAEGFNRARFTLHNANKIRRQYYRVQTARELFGQPPQTNPKAPWEYQTKPMVAVAWQDAMELGDHLSTNEVYYTLPTEGQWEKAARGGLIGMRYAWGNEEPKPTRCDFGRFGHFSILPMRSFPANGYGLFAVNGGVWEWTRDWYDRDYYQHSAMADPEGPEQGKEKVLRGGSWADCAEAVTVSFRMSHASSSWHEREGRWEALSPNIGFRLCRMRRGLSWWGASQETE
jgi:formylglycine-generating enzyme required for sulfatase activity